MRLMLAMAVVAMAVGCAGPKHLSDDYGRSYSDAVARQSVRPPGESVQPVKGLDSQEAAIVSDNYRRSLAPKGQQASEDENVVYVAPPQLGAAARKPLPLPSVPGKDAR